MSEPTGRGGLTGWAAGVIEQFGEPGVGLLVALETIVPPVPSEVVLALAGYLAGEGRVNPVLVVVAATLGSILGALALYGLGRLVGQDRLLAILATFAVMIATWVTRRLRSRTHTRTRTHTHTGTPS